MRKEDHIEYDFVNTEVNDLTNFKIDPLCNSIMITNTGTTICFVNEFPLHPGVPGTNNGEAFIMGGNEGEIYRGILQIRFVGNAGAAMVTQKFYRRSKC